MLRHRSPSLRGFTLLEMMVVVALVAILASLAAPSMRSFTAGQRVKAASFDLYSSLVYARSAAIKHPAGVVRIAPASDGWAGGWTVSLLPASGPAQVLHEHGALPGVEITDPEAHPHISLNQSGRPSAGLNLSLSATGVAGVTGRCIALSLSGYASTRLMPEGGC